MLPEAITGIMDGALAWKRRDERKMARLICQADLDCRLTLIFHNDD